MTAAAWTATTRCFRWRDTPPAKFALLLIFKRWRHSDFVAKLYPASLVYRDFASQHEARAIAGTEIIVNGGKIEIVRDGGEAPGTQVEVRSLFYNLPARRKFLRSESTESRNIEHQLHLQAIGHPQIAFSLLRDDRMLLQLPATVRLSDRIRDLYGAELLQRLVEVSDPAASKIRISGFIVQAGLSRQTRSQQLVCVSGRE